MVVLLTEWLKLMIVAPRALQGLPEERHRGGCHDVIQSVIDRNLPVRGNGVEGSKGEKGGRDLGVRGRPFNFVTGKLLENKSVIRLILIEGLDDVIAIPPDELLILIPLIALRLCIPDHIEPVAPPSLTILGTAQEAVHNTGIGLVPGVA